MGAPSGNKFWELRLKHGRQRVIKSSKALWENAVEYFQWCEDNPFYEVDFRGKDATEVKLPKMRPYTKIGLAIACGLSEWRIIESLKDIDEDFSQVVTRIENVIYEQKFSGAAAGFLNQSIIARDLGLMDKTENNLKGGGFSFNLTMNQPDERNEPIA